MFYNKLQILLSALDYSHDIIISDDFNVKFKSKDRKANVLCDICASFRLHQTVKVNIRQNACLDNIFRNISISSIETDTFDTCISDHLGIAFYFDVKTIKTT